MRLHLEIRAAEGGDDAKLLVGEQFGLYRAHAIRAGYALRVLGQAPGWLLAQVEGPTDVVNALRAEAGGHRWQRVPPGERKGRAHTSTVIVAVLDAPGASCLSGGRPARARRGVAVYAWRGPGRPEPQQARNRCCRHALAHRHLVNLDNWTAERS